MSKGLRALKRLTVNKYANFLRRNEDIVVIEKELKAKANLVSMCENLAKLVGLKEKDYVELETLITKKLKELETINEDLKYGYVFIGYDKDNKPLFQFADTKLYEEIKKNMNY